MECTMDLAQWTGQCKVTHNNLVIRQAKAPLAVSRYEII